MNAAPLPDRRATLCGLLAILLWASLALLTTLTAGLPPFQVLATGFGIAGLLGIAHAALRGRAGWRALKQPLPALALLGMALGPTGAAFLFWDIGTKRGDIALLGSLSYLAPLLSTLLLVVTGRAQPHVSQAVAIALLLCGAWLSVRKPRPSIP